jgi:protein TonB
VPAAVEAVKQWVYQPTLLNGKAVEVIAPIDINFILNQ